MARMNTASPARRRGPGKPPLIDPAPQKVPLPRTMADELERYAKATRQQKTAVIRKALCRQLGIDYERAMKGEVVRLEA